MILRANRKKDGRWCRKRGRKNEDKVRKNDGGIGGGGVFVGKHRGRTVSLKIGSRG